MNMPRSDLAQAVDAAAKPLELAVVLPTFNERNNLETLVARLDEALRGIAWEAIVVDDNSPDGTSDTARAITSQCATCVRASRRIEWRSLWGGRCWISVSGLPLETCI